MEEFKEFMKKNQKKESTRKTPGRTTSRFSKLLVGEIPEQLYGRFPGRTSATINLRRNHMKNT